MPSLESPRFVILSVPGLKSGIFLFMEKGKNCKGNGFQKSFAEGNVFFSTPGSNAGFEVRKPASRALA